jgi:hypothetical protein
MKKIYGAILLIITFCVTSAFQQSTHQSDKVNWREFKFKEGGFKLLLPKEPEVRATAMNFLSKEVLLHAFVSMGEEWDVYIASYLDLPNPINESEIEMVLNDSRVMPKGELLSKKRVTLDGNPGLEFQKKSGVELTIGRIYSVKNRIYIISVFSPEDAESEKLTKNSLKFLDSFRILSP